MNDTNPGIAPDKSPHTAGIFAVDARAAAMAIFFLASGAGVGGGASFFSGNGLKEEVVTLTSEVRALTRSVDSLTSEKHQVEREHDGFRLMLSDHEARIRALEKPTTRRTNP